MALRSILQPQLVREKAVESLKNGHVDLISGNHHNLYVRNANNGEDFVHLAQATNNWTENKLVVGKGIRSVQDLRGKRVVADKLTSHAGLNIWLYLKQEGLDVDRGDIELVELLGSSEDRWKRVLSGEFAGTFVTIPHDARAAAAGAHVIEARAIPMIRGVTLTTTMSFVKSHPEEIRLLTRGFVDAIHFFITRKERDLGDSQGTCEPDPQTPIGCRSGNTLRRVGPIARTQTLPGSRRD